MSKVVALKCKEEKFPSRPPQVNNLTFLVSIFADEPELLPFVRYLFREHGVLSVQQFDRVKGNVFERFGLEPRLRARFKAMIGKPEKLSTRKSAQIVALSHYRLA